MADFLLEIGLEEVPARMIGAAQIELGKRVVQILSSAKLISPAESTEWSTDGRLVVDGVQIAATYSTPRRLAVIVYDVEHQQPDITEETTGPALKIAFKDGVPTTAAEAFARKSGVAVADLRTISTPKGDYLAATVLKKGRPAAEVIATELPKEIGSIYWAKSMYWRPGRPERFVRPILWIACLLGEEIVPLTFAGKTAGRATYGHRVLSSGDPFEIVAPDSYLAQLEGEFVLADVEARRHKIRKALDHVTRTVSGAKWREDHALVDAVTHLTEWPDVLLGNFEPEYLALPEEVLVTVMRDHQKYFALEDASGKLAPHFLAVLNMALDPRNERIIKQGNERVLRARFNDARFFWKFDERIGLSERILLLKNLTFQKDLGSYAEKTERVKSLASRLGRIVVQTGVEQSVDFDVLEAAASLAKADLTTELVKEFTELQGVIGGLYARAQGMRSKIAEAIYDQYIPSSMEDGVPRSTEGALLGIADRADTIAGMFGLGMEPTGSKDPFALRRAANGIVKILAETGISLGLDQIICLSAKDDATTARMRLFFRERVDFYLREVRNQTYDVVKAAMAAGHDDLLDLVARAEAVSVVRSSEDFLAVSAAFKRMKNILDQARAQGEAISSTVNTDAMNDVAERHLATVASVVAGDVSELSEQRNYVAALTRIASLRPAVDSFFSAVMVMAPEKDIRTNRLALLSKITGDFSRIADFSEIVFPN